MVIDIFRDIAIFQTIKSRSCKHNDGYKQVKGSIAIVKESITIGNIGTAGAVIFNNRALFTYYMC